ncbi:MAG: amidohydrolase family protein [Lachnospiraceae bacterium]|nr:amidohydrolase family protein [Lachnospiraceae bacterium]
MFELKMTDYDHQVYEKELKPFLPEKFIDVHTHIGKATFGPLEEKTVGRTYVGNVTRSWPSLSPLGDAQFEMLTDGLKKMFPDNEVIPVLFGDCSHNIHQVNDYVLECGKANGFPMLYRSSYLMPLDELEENVKKGGFLGLKPYLNQRPSYIPPNEIRIFDFLTKEQLEVADRNGWIIMLHIPRPGRLKDKVNLAELMAIEEKYPNVKLIVAHIGRAYSKEDIGDAFEILKNTKNMLFDFTANLSSDAISACIQAVGCKRLMFGSDLPVAFMRLYRITENGTYINVVPKGYYGDVSNVTNIRESENEDITLMLYEQLRAFKRSAMELRLTDTDIEDIMYNNAKKLFMER